MAIENRVGLGSGILQQLLLSLPQVPDNIIHGVRSKLGPLFRSGTIKPLQPVPKRITGSPEDIANFYVGWDRYESMGRKETDESSAGKIIDSNFSGLEVPGWILHRRAHAIDVLEELQGAFKDYADSCPSDHILKRKPEQQRLMEEELKSTKHYLLALKQRPEWPEYVANVMGITVRPIKDEEIKQATVRVEELLDRVLPPRSSKPRDIKRVLGKFMGQEVAQSSFLTEFSDRIEWVIPQLINYLKLPNVQEELSNPSRFMKLESHPTRGFRVDAHYRDIYGLLINAAKKFYFKDGVYFAYHEGGGHLLNYAVMKNNIIRGELFPPHGLRTNHGLHIFASEGGAQTWPFFVPEDVSMMDDAVELTYVWRELRDKVLVNALIRAQELTREGKLVEVESRIKTAIEYAAGLAPILPKREFGYIKEAMENPMVAASDPMYGLSVTRFRNIARSLSPEKRRIFLQKWYQAPYSPQDIDRLVTEII